MFDVYFISGGIFETLHQLMLQIEFYFASLLLETWGKDTYLKLNIALQGVIPLKGKSNILPCQLIKQTTRKTQMFDLIDEWEKEFLKLIAEDEITISCPNFDI